MNNTGNMIGDMSTMPRYRQVTEYLRLKIQSGEFVTGDRIPSDRDLAAQFGVHWQTAHRALRELSNQGLVQRRPRRGTHVAAFVRHYAMVRPLQRTPEGATEYHDLLGHAFLRRVFGGASRGYVLHSPNETGYVENHIELTNMLRQHGIQGVIFDGLCPDDELLALMKQQGVPYVHIHAAEGVAPNVLLDGPAMHRMAFRFLAEQERRSIGVIMGQAQGVSSRDTMMPYADEAGLGHAVSGMVGVFPGTMEEGYLQGLEFLQSHPDLDGLYIADDVLARGVCMALLKLGRQVPETLRLVTHANTGTHYSFPFPVTRVEFDPSVVIDKAMELLARLALGEASLSSHTLVKPKLVAEMYPGEGM